MKFKTTSENNIQSKHYQYLEGRKGLNEIRRNTEFLQGEDHLKILTVKSIYYIILADFSMKNVMTTRL